MRTLNLFKVILVGLVFFAATVLGHGQGSAAKASRSVLRVAAAADLKLPLEEIGREFEKKTGVRVEASLGASGTLFAQIANGAPFHVFMSADREYPKKLADAGLALPETMKNYARGTLVLWMSREWQEKFGAGRKLEMKVLLEKSVNHISIANPLHAPYGRAAEAAMRNAGILDQVRAKLVTAENVAQAAQFVHSGNAEAGLVAFTSVIMNRDAAGHWVEVPRELYPPIDQAVIVTRVGQDARAARDFIEFLSSPQARAVFKKYGFAEASAP